MALNLLLEIQWESQTESAYLPETLHPERQESSTHITKRGSRLQWERLGEPQDTHESNIA